MCPMRGGYSERHVPEAAEPGTPGTWAWPPRDAAPPISPPPAAKPVATSSVAETVDDDVKPKTGKGSR